MVGGDNEHGQIGSKNINEKEFYVLEPKEIEFFSKNNLKIKSIFCSSFQSFILTFEGLVYSFGWNRYQLLGHEMVFNKENVFIPQLIDGLNDIKSFGRTEYKSYFLTNDGFIYFCGYNKSEDSYEKKPKLLSNELIFNDIYSKNFGTIAIKDEEIYELRDYSIIKTKS